MGRGYRAVTQQCARLMSWVMVATLVLGIQAARAADDEPAAAASQRQPSPIASFPSAPSDFLLGAPRAWIGIRGLQMFPRAGGDLFEFVSEQLTVEKADLRGRGFATDVGVVVTPTFDLVGGFDVSRRTTGSEYRRFIASDSSAITQSTSLNQLTLSAGIRWTPAGRGRTISRFAFIPRRLMPYAGGGFTAGYHSFRQQGQFVDYVDLSIFTDRFSTDGWAFGPYVNGGAEVQVWKRLYLTMDGRYSWMQGGISSDFKGFDGIDLAGFRWSSGISVVM